MNAFTRFWRMALQDCKSLFSWRNIIMLLLVWAAVLYIFSGMIDSFLESSARSENAQPANPQMEDEYILPPQAEGPAKWLALYQFGGYLPEEMDDILLHIAALVLPLGTVLVVQNGLFLRDRGGRINITLPRAGGRAAWWWARSFSGGVFALFALLSGLAMQSGVWLAKYPPPTGQDIAVICVSGLLWFCMAVTLLYINNTFMLTGMPAAAAFALVMVPLLLFVTLGNNPETLWPFASLSARRSAAAGGSIYPVPVMLAHYAVAALSLSAGFAIFRRMDLQFKFDSN